MRIHYNPARTHCVLEGLPPGDIHTEIMEIAGGFDVPDDDGNPLVYVNDEGEVFLTTAPPDLEIIENADLAEVFKSLEDE